MVELLKQPQYEPLHFADQVISIYAGTNGSFDAVPVKDVAAIEKELLQFIREQKSEVRDAIIETGALGDDLTASLDEALAEFVKTLEGRFTEE